MTKIRIPNTDLKVSSICMGTGGIGSAINQTDSFQMMDLFIEHGGNFLDTAHVYGDWVPDIPRHISEKTIGAWMKERNIRDRIILGTKGGHPDLKTMNIPRMSPAEIEGDVNESLETLQTDRIDLFWLHRDDPGRPVEEIMDTLQKLVTSGKLRYYAASNWDTKRIEAAQRYAKSRGYDGFVGDQVFWNAAVLGGIPYGDPTIRCMDEERFSYHQATGMAVFPFASQANGYFHRLYNSILDQMNPSFREFYQTKETMKRYNRMLNVIEETGLTLTQVLLGYLRGQPFITTPIVGCRNLQQLTDSLTALDIKLTPEQIRFLEEGE